MNSSLSIHTWKYRPLLDKIDEFGKRKPSRSMIQIHDLSALMIEQEVDERFWKVNKEALYAMFSLILQIFPEIYNTIVVSNLSDATAVAGVGLGVMLINMFVHGTFEGLNGAIDTYVSQYYGSGDYLG